MDNKDITITIVAYNAESTIKRAVGSAIACGNYPILLVDDQSTDQTVALAKDLAGKQIRAISTTGPHGVGKARQTALDNIKTPYGIWLDADDEILPGRPEAFADVLRAGADLVYGEGVLVAPDGSELPLTIPFFLSSNAHMVRNFERNWLPLLHCGFDIAVARSIGFDTSFSCAEDYDFLLRAISANAVINTSSNAGYKHFHSPDSISRNLTKTRRQVKEALKKHPDNVLANLLSQSPLSEAEQYHIVASNMLYQDRPKEALEPCGATLSSNIDHILPQYGRPTKWIARFLLASACWQQGLWQQSSDELGTLPYGGDAPEVLNNLGACSKKMSDPESAEQLFKKALELKPSYADAALNLKNLNTDSTFFTSHPFRQHSSRDIYD